MDRNFYDNDFEEFLKQKSDQYKMYPSDRVWNNVYSSLHGRKKWWALGFTLFFVATGLLVGREMVLSNYSTMASELNQVTDETTIAPASNTVASKGTLPAASSKQHIANSANSTFSAIVSQTKQKSQNNNTVYSHLNSAANATSFAEKSADSKDGSINPEHDLVIGNNLPASIPSIKKNTALSFSIPQSSLTLNEKLTEKVAVKKDAGKLVSQIEQAAVKPSLDNPSRWALQIYASPTISYRRLSNFDQQQAISVPVAAGNAGNINNYVHHKPAPGFEIGTNVQYKLSDNLSVFAGAQLNYSRYYIDAFKYHTEKASIALNSSSQSHDTLSGYTNIRNLSGYAPEQLQNKYMQLSIPVGIEIKLLGNRKLQFNIAGGVQPTFLVSSTTYLISSDYKNYIQGPDLARSFNVHTNFEAFVSYKTGGLKWQVGPQFRSQLLSSYSNKYGVREYLTEYGIKFGVTRSF